MKTLSSGLITPTQIIENVLLSDDLTTMRQNLRAMADAYLLSEDEANNRHKVYSTYMVLDNILEKTEKISNKERRVA